MEALNTKTLNMIPRGIHRVGCSSSLGYVDHNDNSSSSEPLRLHEIGSLVKHFCRAPWPAQEYLSIRLPYHQ